jgi:hypothetical protein
MNSAPLFSWNFFFLREILSDSVLGQAHADSLSAGVKSQSDFLLLLLLVLHSPLIMLLVINSLFFLLL